MILRDSSKSSIFWAMLAKLGNSTNFSHEQLNKKVRRSILLRNSSKSFLKAPLCREWLRVTIIPSLYLLNRLNSDSISFCWTFASSVTTSRKNFKITACLSRCINQSFCLSKRKFSATTRLFRDDILMLTMRNQSNGKEGCSQSC